MANLEEKINDRKSSRADRLRALDPDLPFCLAQAAIGIGLQRQGKRAGTHEKYIKEIADLLENSKKGTLDPGTEWVLCKFFVKIGRMDETGPIRSIYDVIPEVVDDLRRYKEITEEQQTSLIRFCIDTAKECMSYRAGVYSFGRRYLTAAG